MQNFTIIDIYKCMLVWQRQAYLAAKQNHPVLVEGGKLSCPVDDNGEAAALENILILERALTLMDAFKN